MDISASEVPTDAVPGVGAGHTTQERGPSTTPRTAAVCSGAAWPKRLGGGGRPRAVLHVGNATTQQVGPGQLDSSIRERPNTRTEDTAEPRTSCTSRPRQGKKRVHSLIDKVFSRKNLERAWEKVKKNRGSAGIDEVTIAVFETRKGYYLDLLHRKLRDVSAPPRETGGDTEVGRRCQEARDSHGAGSGVPASPRPADGTDL